MADYKTELGSLGDYRKGGVHIINDDPRNYVFSNAFEVASKSAPFERVCVAKNLEYVIEIMRAEGASLWFTAAHDEFALCLDGEIEVELMKHGGNAPEGDGAHRAGGRARRPAHGTRACRARPPDPAAGERRLPFLGRGAERCPVPNDGRPPHH